MSPTVKIPPALPGVDRINPDYCYNSDRNRLVKLREYVEARRPVWWRRGAFRKEFAGTEPKWHVFNGRARSTDPDTKWNFTWYALCGFENDRAELLGGFREFKVGTPKKGDRCIKCSAVLAEITKVAA